MLLPFVRLPEQPSHQLWPGTSSWASISHHSKRARSLLATELEVSNSNASAICTSSELPWPAIPGYGHLVSDNWVCTNPNRPDKVGDRLSLLRARVCFQTQLK